MTMTGHKSTGTGSSVLGSATFSSSGRKMVPMSLFDKNSMIDYGKYENTLKIVRERYRSNDG